MTLGKAKQMVFVLAAIFSLAASSIAACACDHHQIQPTTAPSESSCHGTAHAQPRASENSDQAPSGDRLETGCNCVVVDPGPSVFANARGSVEVFGTVPGDRIDISIVRVPVEFQSPSTVFLHITAEYDLLRSTRAPARAPPRL